MRIQSNGSNGNPRGIGRRRGTPPRGGKTFPDQKMILVLAAVAATIFASGLMLGTHIYGSPQISDTSAASSVSQPSLNNEHSSPLLAATSRIAASDVQRLIMESAAAEAFEEEERRQEEEALKHGDKTLALHLRGALVPGDPNYNPHHHIDDTLDVDDPLNSNQEIVGGSRSRKTCNRLAVKKGVTKLKETAAEVAKKVALRGAITRMKQLRICPIILT
ncbi:hypothetical protein QTG54_000793 [Skeletonema marinoi]|uniref:Uncharacterized protein n=1 Tax=Skeletonema marinoi TaxID=267567 RepID=A0AAD8YLJ5_9STRA|nr:hypothetical protein QTG54_000793 [Skeletonema marinoi]